MTFTKTAVLVFNTTGAHLKDQTTLDEIYELGRSANIKILTHFSQSYKKPHPATFVGSGKIEEIHNFILENPVDLVIFNTTLTGSQTRNIQNKLHTPVIDRNQLILKIFADRAHSYAGRLQVELAQKLDELPRMKGAWLGSLSRQGGGTGAERGPGEKALEMDRRQIQKKIRILRKKLQTLRETRYQQRKLRKRNQVCQFALIGYTNSGKSALLNYLSNSPIASENQLFLTLDPTTKKIFVPNLPSCVMTDTVGFIQNLPPHLIDAFKATLEESGEADVILHMIDLSSPNMKEQTEVVNKLIEAFGWDNKPIIYVYNKSDCISPDKTLSIESTPFRSIISAHTGDGIPQLLKEMRKAFISINKNVELFFPLNEEHQIYTLDREACIHKTEKGQGGTLCYATLPSYQIAHWKNFILRLT